VNGPQPDIHTLTGAYVCDALEPGERAEFEQHMRECVSCEAEVAELREVAANLATAVAEEPPASLKPSVDARRRVTRQLPPILARTDLAPRGRWRDATHWAGWAAAAVLAGFVAGLSVHAAAQQHQITSISSRANMVQRLLTAPDAAVAHAAVGNGGHAVVVYSRSSDEVAVVLGDLPALPPGKTYQLWLMGPGGAATARSIGLVPASVQASNAPVLAAGLGSARTVGMTAEPAGGTTRPTTTPVMLVPLGT
jgi:anti-sigma-K factor RskA